MTIATTRLNLNPQVPQHLVPRPQQPPHQADSKPQAIILEYCELSPATTNHAIRVNQAYQQSGGDGVTTLFLNDFEESYDSTQKFNGSLYDTDTFFNQQAPVLTTEDDIRQYILAQMDFELGRLTTVLNTVRTDSTYSEVGVINYSVALTEASFLQEVKDLLSKSSDLTPQDVEALIDRIVDGEDEQSADHVNTLFSQLAQSSQALYESQGTMLVAGTGNSRTDAASFESDGIEVEADEDDTLLNRILGEQEHVVFAAAHSDMGGYEPYSSYLSDQPRQYAAIPIGTGTSFAAPVISAHIQQLQASNPSLTADEIHASLATAFPEPSPTLYPHPSNIAK